MGDDHRDGQREGCHPSPVEHLVRARQMGRRPHHGRNRRRGQPTQTHSTPPRDPRAARACPALPERQQGRKRSPDQDGCTARVGPVVGPARILHGVRRRERRRRRHGSHATHDDEPPQTSLREIQHRTQHQRPQQVELLLDPQRPRVLQRRRRSRLREVVTAAEDHPPVGHVEQRCHPITAQQPHLLGRQQRPRTDRDGRDHQEQSRQQPPYPPSPEASQVGSVPHCEPTQPTGAP